MPLTKILVAEGSQADRSLVDQALENEGYAIVHVNNVAEALRSVSSEEIHIAFVSTLLPDGDWHDLARGIRARRRERPLQLLLLSSAQQAGATREYIEAGADDFIIKPFDPLELQTRTRAAVLRWENEFNLLKEREFYRIAVAEEERLSSLVLDQNLHLKEAYEKIRGLNEQLEKANKELEQIAAFDSLSGLLNRRSLFQRIGVEIERAIRFDIPLTGLMVDIDHFKNVNDNYGHQCGDAVIREIGVKLLAGLRKYDYAGRYGGEEFFVLLSNSTEQQSLRIGERFRRDMEEFQLTCGTETIRITISIGVARYHPGESLESWIERADRAMYRAKQAGRNRILAD
jgi:diguanylate cyclase (GGDEF)-like protein